MILPQKFIIAVCFSGLTVFTTLGCGSSGPPLGYVEGKVTLNGQPLPHARVTFQPQATGSSPSTGITDENGHYELQFSLEEKGAMIDTHQVRISTFAQSNDGKPPLPEKVPAEYNDATTLECEVKSGKNTHDFELKGKANS
jgi:hypothetical protein